MPVIDGKIFKTLYVDRGPTKYKTLTVDKGPTKYKTLFVDRSQTQYKPLTWNKGPTKYKTLTVDRGPTKYKSLKYQLEQEDTPYQVLTDKMIERNKVIEPLSPGHPEATSSINYFPTHFLPSEPRRPFFRGEDERFNSPEARRNLLVQLKQSIRNAHRMPDMGSVGTGGRNLYIADAPSDDFIRYYIELHDRKIFDYDLLRVTEGDSSALELSSSSNVEEGVQTYGGNANESYWLSLSRRIDSLEFSSGVPDLEPYPGWYRGFTGDTVVEYWPRQNGTGKIEFHGQSSVLGLSSVIDFGINYQKNKRNALVLARKTGSNQWESDIVFVTDLGRIFGHNLVFEDFFNKIKFYSDGPVIDIEKIIVKYNEETVCHTGWLREDGRISDNTVFFRISNGHPLDIATFLSLTKHRAVGYSSSDVLKTAANELGHSWCQKYNSEWEKVGWCGPFNNWLLDNSTELKEYSVWDGSYDYLFFKSLNSLFNEYAGKTFTDLYDRIDPGAKVRMTVPKLSVKRPGDYIHHISTFINWTEELSNRSRFNAIGGDQSRRVKISNFLAIDEKSFDPYYINGKWYFVEPLNALYFRANKIPAYDDYFANVSGYEYEVNIK